MTYEKIADAARAISEASGRNSHDVGLVLGSGLSGFADGMTGAVVVDAGSIGFPQPKVVGHAGSIVSAELAGVSVLISAGRVHAYEGWDMSEVVFGVRALALAGCQTVILTNASGGLNPAFAPGDLVAISDHINFAGRNPLIGLNDDRLGPRFPDLSAVYPADLRDMIAKSAVETGMDYKEGIYAWHLGPSYETPAEIRMLRGWGADMVGMSTVPEAIALAHMGIPVVGISLVTNLAAGIGTEPLSHEEVTETAALAKDRFASLLMDLIPRIPTS